MYRKPTLPHQPELFPLLYDKDSKEGINSEIP
jgi:hypothetical protein